MIHCLRSAHTLYALEAAARTEDFKSPVVHPGRISKAHLRLQGVMHPLSYEHAVRWNRIAIDDGDFLVRIPTLAPSDGVA